MAATTSFSIPAQPLSSALMTLGRQADVQILTASDAIAGRRSASTTGTLTVEAALGQVLQGTGLDYEAIGVRTVVVAQRAFKPAVSFESSLSGTKPSVPIVSTLDTVSVSSAEMAELGFKASAVYGAARADVDLADLPQSVSVVTRDLIDSQQAFDVADAVRHVAGVNYVDGYGGPPLFSVRGFNIGNGLTDGMPNGVARIQDLPPLIGIERVEVLKGPEAILGESSTDNNFGGSMNIVMKRPQADPVREMEYSVGRYDGTRLGFDFAGPLDAQGQLTYRWIAAGNYADHTAQGYRGQRSLYLAPSIAWQDDSTNLLFGVEYVDNRVPVPDHTVLLGDDPVEFSAFGVLPGNPDDHAMFRTKRAFYQAEQSLGDGWSVRSRAQYVRQGDSGQSWSFVNTERSGQADALANAYRYSDAFYTLQNELAGSFEQGVLTHNVLLGFDYARTHVGSSVDPGSFTVSAPYEFNLLTGGALPSARSQALSIAQVRPLGGSWSANTGVFVQDLLSIGDSWDLLGTLRRTTYEQESRAEGNMMPPWRRSIWIPRLGVVYKPARGVSVYASSATGFQADSMLGEDGQSLPPSVSRQIELGAKFDLFDQRARLTTALYRIRLDHSVNQISPDPPYFAVPGPGQTNSGVEVEFVGQLSPGLDISTSYTGARIRNRDGTAPSSAPRNQFNAWVSYRFQHGLWQSWGVAGGIFARSRSLERTDAGSYFSLPGQASAEANVSYYADRWRATLGVKNLFARTLYAVNAEASFVPLREGRVVLLSGTYEF